MSNVIEEETQINTQQAISNTLEIKHPDNPDPEPSPNPDQKRQRELPHNYLQIFAWNCLAPHTFCRESVAGALSIPGDNTSFVFSEPNPEFPQKSAVEPSLVPKLTQSSPRGVRGRWLNLPRDVNSQSVRTPPMITQGVPESCPTNIDTMEIDNEEEQQRPHQEPADITRDNETNHSPPHSQQEIFLRSGSQPGHRSGSPKRPLENKKETKRKKQKISSDSNNRNDNPDLKTKNKNKTTTNTEILPATQRHYTFEWIPDDVKIHLLGFLNGFDYVSLLFVNKKLHQLYWSSIGTLIATTPRQMDVMKTVLKKIMVEHPSQLPLLRNVGWWSAPGNVKFPVDREALEILHMCRNVVRVIFGKGQHVINVKYDDFQLLRSLQNLELIEIDHIDLDSSAFTSPIAGSYCSNQGCTYCSSCSNGRAAASLIEHFPNLKSFRVRGVNCLPGDSILRQLKNANGMKRIGIWGSGQMSDSEILSLAPLTDLTELILSSCTSSGDRSVFQILVKMKLKHLGLFYASNNNAGQDEDFRILSEIPSLTSFHLGGWNLSNNAFRHLSKNENLQNLSISRAQAISREGIAEIVKNATITTLRISACIFLRDYDLAPVVFMKQLQRLDLDNTKSITDNFLKFLSEKTDICDISELYLMGIPLISDRGIAHLEHFRSLKILVIKNCQNVTEESVKKLRENHISAWVGKLQVTLDNSEYIQKQQQQQQQAQRQPAQPMVLAPQQLVQQLQVIEQQVEQKLSQIKEQQPLQEEQGLQTAYQYQEQLQQLHNMLHSQQRLQQQLQQYQQNRQPYFQFQVPQQTQPQPQYPFLVQQPQPQPQPPLVQLPQFQPQFQEQPQPPQFQGQQPQLQQQFQAQQPQFQGQQTEVHQVQHTQQTPQQNNDNDTNSRSESLRE